MSDRYTLHHGDCIDVMRTMPDASVDAIVTDPPYELGFMGKSWDASGIAFNVDVWREALRVLKPGGHLLAFSGSRTYHRMAVAIEDAEFEIRDQIMWIYGSGFPKSLDVSKAIDKVNGEGDRLLTFTRWMRTTGVTVRQLNDATGTFMGSHYLTDKSQPAIPTPDLWQLIRPLIADVPVWVDELVERIEAEREVVGLGAAQCSQLKATGVCDGHFDNGTLMVKHQLATAPATPAAREWQGWGTALKPAHEPIVLARKPLTGTVAANVLTWGTGALNIDGTRVGTTVETWPSSRSYSPGQMQPGHIGETQQTGEVPSGRWPANVIHDGSDEVVGLFPSNAGAGGKASGPSLNGTSSSVARGVFNGVNDTPFYGDSGSAARFFYCAKASKRDRNEGLDGFEERDAGIKNSSGRGFSESDPMKPVRTKNHHPTVKPTDLMRYLIRLVTPPQGVVLDPFTGSGSTGKAAMLEGNRFIGIEQDADYIAIADARIRHALATPLEDVIFPRDEFTDSDVAQLANPGTLFDDEASA